MVVGSLIILLNYLLPSLVCYIEKRRVGGVRYATLEWFTTGTLQLQRLAHEGLGYGEWSKCDDEIPIASPNKLLAVLDVRNPKHPQLELSGTQVDGEDSRDKFVPTDEGLKRQPSMNAIDIEFLEDQRSEKHGEVIKQTIVHTATDRTLTGNIEVSSHPALSE